MQVIPHLYLSLLQAIPFLVCLIALYVILWKPLLAYLDERQSAHLGARREADRLSDEIDNRMTELNEKLAAAKSDIATQRAAARAKAQVEEGKIIGAARGEADKKVGEAVARIGDAKNAASASLETMSASLSTDIASQVLGREVSA